MPTCTSAPHRHSSPTFPARAYFFWRWVLHDLLRSHKQATNFVPARVSSCLTLTQQRSWEIDGQCSEVQVQKGWTGE